jgi:protease-4
VILVWIVTGPIFGFSDTWQLGFPCTSASSATEKLTELLEHKPTPVAAAIGTTTNPGANALLSGRGPASALARDITRELDVLLRYNDPRGVYARMPFVLRIR